MLKFRTLDDSDQDYQIIYDIQKTVWPDTKWTLEGMKNADSKAPAGTWSRLIAEWDGRPIGHGIYMLERENDVPGQYFTLFCTLPDYQNRGIASAYLDILQNELLADKQVTSLLSHTRDDKPEAIRFLENRGFTLELRIVSSAIDLVTFDPAPFAPLRQKIREKGITIRPLSELMKSDPAYAEKLERLEWTLANDEPRSEPPRRKTVQEFIDVYIDTPYFYPEGWLVATAEDDANGNYIGWSAIFGHPNQPDVMRTGITVIDRPYRRMGLATAMKIAGFEHAQSIGKKRIETSNEETNPMLDLNKRLGFRPMYMWLDYKKSP